MGRGADLAKQTGFSPQCTRRELTFGTPGRPSVRKFNLRLVHWETPGTNRRLAHVAQLREATRRAHSRHYRTVWTEVCSAGAAFEYLELASGSASVPKAAKIEVGARQANLRTSHSFGKQLGAHTLDTIAQCGPRCARPVLRSSILSWPVALRARQERP